MHHAASDGEHVAIAASGTAVDVLIIGSGIAGLAAAVSAREAGAERVLVVEAQPIIGGSSRLAGTIVGAGTALQRAAGIDDSPGDMFDDYMNVNQWGLNGSVTRRFAEQSGPTVDWLAELGTVFHPQLVRSGADRVARCAVPAERGQGIIDALLARALALDVQVVTGERVDSLLVDDDGAVVGAAAGAVQLRARAVVIATGGIGASPDKIARYLPDVAASGDWVWYVGSEGSRGDGIDLGLQVGAEIVGQGTGLALLTPNFTRTNESYLPGWLVVVDTDGRRVVNEAAYYSVVGRRMSVRGGPFYALFDAQALDSGIAAKTASFLGTSKAYPGHADRPNPNWNPAMLQQKIDEGAIVEADTAEQLAARLGIDPPQLRATIDRYNEGAAAGADALAKDPAFLRPLDQTPLYAAELRIATISVTGTGVRIDAEARVIDGLGRAIPGLFAAGEAAGGILGTMYPSSGASLASGATFGRIAGRNAAATAEAPAGAPTPPTSNAVA